MSAAAERAQQMWWGRPDATVIPFPRPSHAAPPPARGQGRCGRSVLWEMAAIACMVLSLASLVIVAVGASTAPASRAPAREWVAVREAVLYDLGGLAVLSTGR